MPDESIKPESTEPKAVRTPQRTLGPGFVRRAALAAMEDQAKNTPPPAEDMAPLWDADVQPPVPMAAGKDHMADAEPWKDDIDEAPEKIAEGDAVEDEPQKTPEQDSPRVAEDSDVIEIDGQQIAISELRSGYMRQADYTRKTKAMADLRREAQGLKDTIAVEQQNMRQYLHGMFSDPKNLIEQLQIYMPPEHMYGLAVELWQDAYSLAQMEDKDRDRELHYRRLDQERKQGAIRESTEKQQAEAKKKGEAARARAERYRKVVPEILKDVGLPLTADNEGYNRDVINLLRQYAVDMHGTQDEYSDEELRSAAEAMASGPMGKRLSGNGDITALEPDQLAKQLGPDARAKLRAYESQLLKEQQKRGKPTGGVGSGNAGRKPDKQAQDWVGLRRQWGV